MTREEMKVRIEKNRAEAERIKAEYHCTKSFRTGSAYQVETQGLHNIWFPGHWYFSSVEDAMSYVAAEVKAKEVVRIVELTWISAHEMNSKVVWNKEV